MVKQILFASIISIISWIPLKSQHFVHDSLFNFDWKFKKGEIKSAQLPYIDDSDWRIVDLPHDWSIEDLEPVGSSSEKTIRGPFDSNALGGKYTVLLLEELPGTESTLRFQNLI